MFAPVLNAADIAFSIDLVRKESAGLVEAQLLGCAMGGEAACRQSSILKRIADGQADVDDAETLETEFFGYQQRRTCLAAVY